MIKEMIRRLSILAAIEEAAGGTEYNVDKTIAEARNVCLLWVAGYEDTGKI